MPIVSFTLRDAFLLARLQKLNTSLCPIETLTRPQSPLWRALTALLAFDESQTLTFVLDEPRRDSQKTQGFIQLRQPSTRPEMYLRCLAPRLDAAENAQATWNRLLTLAITRAGERGIHRLFACTTMDSAESEILHNVGFSAYTRENIFRLAPDAYPQATAKKGIRPEQSVDSWAVQRLYRAVTPHLVQQAESLTQKGQEEWIYSPISWHQGEGFVLENKEKIVGYGHLTPGHTGHWLTLLVDAQEANQTDALIDYGLALLNYYPPVPVYCAVREYQGGVQGPLQDRGFEFVSTQCCLVKHTTVRVQETVPGLVPALEKRAQAPTTTVTSSEQ